MDKERASSQTSLLTDAESEVATMVENAIKAYGKLSIAVGDNDPGMKRYKQFLQRVYGEGGFSIEFFFNMIFDALDPSMRE